MRAAYIEDWGKPMVIKDAPKPAPGPLEVLVKISVSGVCHTDLHQWRGDWPGTKYLMEKFNVRIIGHEGVGIVEDVGPGVTLLSKGDRVGVPWINYWCGNCEACLEGKPHWCSYIKFTSVHVDGTHAEYAIISERAAVRIPRELKDEDVAGMICGGVTAYNAVRKLITEARIPPGKPIAIVGAAGGLGHYAVQISKAFGYKVVGIDIGAERVEFVEKLGADYAIDATEAEKFVREKIGRVYAALVFTPRISGYDLALKLLRPLGTLVVVGIPDEKEGPIKVTPRDVISLGLRLIPIRVGVTHEFQGLFSLAVEGRVKSKVSLVEDLSNINRVLEELEHGRYTGRAVLRIS